MPIDYFLIWRTSEIAPFTERGFFNSRKEMTTLITAWYNADKEKFEFRGIIDYE